VSAASSMQRLCLTLSYDGRPWQGWQGQLHGQGVQNQLQQAFQRLTGLELLTEAASRTDRGVHALGQVLHTDLPEGMSPLKGDQWLRGLNDRLPPSIRVLAASTLAAEAFHARFDATGKRYRYLIYTGSTLPPLLHDRAWHCPGQLDKPLLEQAAAELVGRHNFRRLSSKRQDVAEHSEEPHHTTRQLQQITMQSHGPLLTLTVEGSGFLYRMVRVIIGSLIHLGRGRCSLADFRQLLQQPEGPRSTQCAPAAGLYLQRIYYARHPELEERLRPEVGLEADQVAALLAI
jgi:tRNA pseudouridine38-40 synthase